jgi:lysophospholipase L1-like esterase
MHLSQPGAYPRWLSNGVFIAILLISVACSSGIQSNHSTQVPSSIAIGALPGQQIWKQGVSSFLFGTNDTNEWSPQNIQTEPAIQDALQSAGFTLIRTIFPDNAKDADIENRIRTIENSNAHCLGIITNISNVTFDKHLVQYLGDRCLMYEFGNESDYNGISIDTYLKQWNTLIPLLRHINPDAKFIGPVTYNDQGINGYMIRFLKSVKSSGILPDVISFHWYPCWHDTREDCLAKASGYSQAVLGVRQKVQIILGKDLPVGISEWNYDPGNPPPAYRDEPDFISRFTTDALNSMIQAGVAFACQFDAASYAGYGRLDMFNIQNNQPKPQYFAIKALIQKYRPANVAIPTTVPTIGGNPGPLISRGKPVFCSANDDGPGGAGAIVDGHYGNRAFWRAAQSTLPSWCAIHLGTGPDHLLLIWASDYVFDYTSNSGRSPQNYTISVSSDSTDGADGTWHTVVTVVGNHTRTREQLIPFTGQSWVKMMVTQVQPQASQKDLAIDEIDVYDVSNSANLNDTFYFLGASITTIAFNRFNENQPSFAEDVHAASPQHFPAMLDGGIGGWLSSDAAQNIDTLLSLNPDMHYWLIELGTNDALDQVSPAAYMASLQVVIDKIKTAGHVPIIAHITYANLPGDRGISLNQKIQALNAIIDQLTAKNKLIPGPDLYQLLRAHAAAYLDADGIHPSPAGAIAINLALFEALRPYLYK